MLGFLLILAGVFVLVVIALRPNDRPDFTGMALGFSGLWIVGGLIAMYGASPTKEEKSATMLEPELPEPKPAQKMREEIVRKEVIVKIRCRYCNYVYDETLDSCPHCGANR